MYSNLESNHLFFQRLSTWGKWLVEHLPGYKVSPWELIPMMHPASPGGWLRSNLFSQMRKLRFREAK